MMGCSGELKESVMTLIKHTLNKRFGVNDLSRLKKENNVFWKDEVIFYIVVLFYSMD